MKRNEIMEAKMNELMAETLELLERELEQDSFYFRQKAILAKHIAAKDMDMLWEQQMTIHNIEMEAAYKAGHRDCLRYLNSIGSLL